jgi:ATP-dependent helicase Lhr and Lhr-like helicase
MRMGDAMLPKDPDELLAVHQRIRERLPITWSAFFARFGRLRPVQLAAIPEILKGGNVLITAPTAGGKTEAVAAPLCELLKANRWSGLSIVLITPTRALVNDLFYRLEKPCQELGVALARKTSDHALPREPTEQFVITTPESLESLLTFNRERLVRLRAVVIDEVHLLDGTPRGDQLRFLLRRLETYLRYKQGEANYSLQRVAISATVANPGATAAAYLGENACVVSVPGQRAIESKTILVEGDDEGRAREAMLAVETFQDVRKVLIFVNSRRQADLAGLYRHGPFEHAPLYGHHGDLSKHRRESTEQRFKSDKRAICLATMTLEVGIDIGDVDLVVCMDPPFSLGSFLQRIGRGCRRLEGRTRVLCVARDRNSELIFEALIAQASRGLPLIPYAPVRRSVLVQQALAYLRQVDKHARTVEQLRKTLTLAAHPAFPGERVAEVVTSLVEGNLLRIQNEVAEPGPEGWSFIESQQIYSNIASSFSKVALVDADTGKRLADVGGLEAGAGGVQIGGRSYEVVGNHAGRVRVLRGTAGGQPAPTYAARRLPYAADIGRALAGRFEIDGSELLVLDLGDRLAAFTWLGRLQNLCLEGLLGQKGVQAKARSFSVHLRGVQPCECLKKLTAAVLDEPLENPLPNLPVEKVVDLGPYFELLTEEQQKSARGDWFQIEALRGSVSKLSRVRLVERDGSLGKELAGLAGI